MQSEKLGGIVDRRSRLLRWPLVAAAALMLARLGVMAALAIPYQGLASALCRRDCGWYMSVVEQGYFTSALVGPLAGQANWAFFPLYPLLVSAVATLGPKATEAGVLVSTIACTGFAIVFVRYVQTTRASSPIGPWLLLVAVWPFGFYEQLIYSEGLYALLAALTMLFSQRARWLPAAAAAALLSATRPSGILLSLWVAGCAAREGNREFLSRTASFATIAARYLLPIAVAPLGLFAFAAFLRWRTGDALAFSHVQIAWWKEAGNPIVNLWGGLHSWDLNRLGYWRTYQSETLDAAFALLGLAAAIFLALRRRFLEAYFCAATVLLPLSSGLHSMPRYVGANPAFLLAVGDQATMIENRWLRAVILAFMALSQIGLTYLWFEGAVGLE